MRDKLFKRYASPLDLLGTIVPDKLVDFLLYVYDEIDKDKINATWLHKDFNEDFMNKAGKDIYKAFNFVSRRDKLNAKSIAKQEQEQALKNIEAASRYVKIRKE